jgi:hypothetical protein
MTWALLKNEPRVLVRLIEPVVQGHEVIAHEQYIEAGEVRVRHLRVWMHDIFRSWDEQPTARQVAKAIITLDCITKLAKLLGERKS